MTENNNQSSNQETRFEESSTDRKKLIWTISGVGILLLLVILFFALNGESNYERGEKYLKQNQYPEALAEFQKVETDDKDFKMAQSKINYIKGITAFNNGLKPEAKTYLLQVNPKDEYYTEAMLIVDKINLTSKEADLEKLTEALKNNKDTVIIREKVMDTTRQKTGEAGTNSNNENKNISIIYVLNLEKIVKGFESHYLTARNVKTDSKKEYVIMDSLQGKFNELDNSSITPEAEQLKDYTSSYMQKRMDYILKTLDGNSGNESTELKYLKEDGDKMYNQVMTQIKQLN